MKFKIVFCFCFVGFGLSSCQEKNEISIEDYEDRSRELFNNKSYRKCLDLQTDYPNVKLNESCLNYRGWSYALINEEDSSKMEFYKSYKLNNKNKNALLGLSQFGFNRLDKINYGIKYVELIGDSSSIAKAYQRIGHNYKLEKDYDRAVSSYDSSIAFLGISINDNERAYILYKKAYSQYLNRDYSSALRTLEKYIKINPERTDSKRLRQLVTSQLDSIN